jgi:hypothetical protein
MKTYRTDELGDEINKKLTLWDVYVYLSQGYNVYKVIGVHDSVIREREYLKKWLKYSVLNTMIFMI